MTQLPDAKKSGFGRFLETVFGSLKNLVTDSRIETIKVKEPGIIYLGNPQEAAKAPAIFISDEHPLVGNIDELLKDEPDALISAKVAGEEGEFYSMENLPDFSGKYQERVFGELTDKFGSIVFASELEEPRVIGWVSFEDGRPQAHYKPTPLAGHMLMVGTSGRGKSGHLAAMLKEAEAKAAPDTRIHVLDV